MPRPLKRGIIILSKDINKYAFMCGSNFYESDVTFKVKFRKIFFNADAHFISSHQMLLNVELRILNFPVRSEKETRGPIRCENM